MLDCREPGCLANTANVRSSNVTPQPMMQNRRSLLLLVQAEKERVPAHDVLIIMGDFNAKVDSGNFGREHATASQGCGNMNENGEMLCNLCGLNNRTIGGTLFAHKNLDKLTWISPNARDQN